MYLKNNVASVIENWKIDGKRKKKRRAPASLSNLEIFLFYDVFQVELLVF